MYIYTYTHVLLLVYLNQTWACGHQKSFETIRVLQRCLPVKNSCRKSIFNITHDGSMDGIYANIKGVILMVNVTIYSSTMDPMGYLTTILFFFPVPLPNPTATRIPILRRGSRWTIVTNCHGWWSGETIFSKIQICGCPIFKLFKMGWSPLTNDY